MQHLIARLKTKPLPVRRRIATATAGAFTAMVAFVWFTASVALGSFGQSPTVAAAPIRNANVAAVGAVIPAPATQDSTAALTIVQTDSSSTISPSSGDRTIIPF